MFATRTPIAGMLVAVLVLSAEFGAALGYQQPAREAEQPTTVERIINQADSQMRVIELEMDRLRLRMSVGRANLRILDDELVDAAPRPGY